MSLFDFFANFDWISPTRAFVETAINGVGHTFYVGLDSGRTGAQCERILKKKGIGVYGRCIANGDAFWQVSTRQAEYAEYLLLKAGIPLKYHLFSERNVKYLGQTGPKPQKSFFEKFLGI